MILQDLPTLKCSKQTSVPAAIIYSLPLSQRIPWIHYFPVDTDVGQFLSILLAFKNTKTSRHSEIKQSRPSTKQDFSVEALSKQNTEASLASLSCNSSRAMTDWSAIFAFGVLVWPSLEPADRISLWRDFLFSRGLLCTLTHLWTQ